MHFPCMPFLIFSIYQFGFSRILKYRIGLLDLLLLLENQIWMLWNVFLRPFTIGSVKWGAQWLLSLNIFLKHFCIVRDTGPRSAVGNVSGYRCVSDADPGVASSIPARYHTFVEIDHEIISTVILLPSTDYSRRVVVSYKRKYVHKLLVNRLLKPAQEKVWLSELTVPQWP